MKANIKIQNKNTARLIYNFLNASGAITVLTFLTSKLTFSSPNSSIKPIIIGTAVKTPI